MTRLEEWLQREFSMDKVEFVEQRPHGHVLKGTQKGKTVDMLVVTSGHVWLKKPTESSWSTTGIYVPDRVLF